MKVWGKDLPIKNNGEKMRIDECKIRRYGFPLTKQDAQSLLDIIDILNPNHNVVEAEVYVKLEILAGKYRIVKA